MTDSVTLYGISNCDTIKKAKAWLGAREIDFRFHDYRKQGLERDLLEAMESALGWQALLNRRGTTWRALPDEVKDNIERESALAAMLENPALIKRPVLATGHRGYDLGFSDDLYTEIFARP